MGVLRSLSFAAAAALLGPSVRGQSAASQPPSQGGAPSSNQDASPSSDASCPWLADGSEGQDSGLSLRQLRGERLPSTLVAKADDIAGAGAAEDAHRPGSCGAFGCDAHYHRGRPCQCNAACKSHGNCCTDYSAVCHLGAPAARVPGAKPAARAGSAAVAASEAHREELLKIVDAFLDGQPRQQQPSGGAPGNRGALLQTYGALPAAGAGAGGPCGKACKLPPACPPSPNREGAAECHFDVYDNAVAAIYYAKRGRLDEARHILDAFVRLLYPKGKIPGLTFGPGDHLPSGRWMSLLAASYTKVPAEAGTYEGLLIADGAVDTGNNAWVGLAFAHFAAAAAEPCYATVARDIMQALKRVNECQDHLRGFMARLNPYPGKYRSTEHNTDVFALASVLHDHEAQARAGTFVRSMYGFDERYSHAYAVGTDGASKCDTGRRSAPAATDAQFWSLLADVDPSRTHKAAALTAALKPKVQGGLLVEDVDRIGAPGGLGRGRLLRGFKFTSWGNGAQWELTASALMAMAHFRRQHGDHLGSDGAAAVSLGQAINETRASLVHLLREYKSVPASVLGGNLQAWKNNDHKADYPGGSDTGIDWTYLRYPHLAATAWTGLMLLYQADDALPPNEDANPFQPPLRPVPGIGRSGATGAAATCVPTAAGSSRGGR